MLNLKSRSSIWAWFTICEDFFWHPNIWQNQEGQKCQDGGYPLRHWRHHGPTHRLLNHKWCGNYFLSLQTFRLLHIQDLVIFDNLNQHKNVSVGWAQNKNVLFVLLTMNGQTFLCYSEVRNHFFIYTLGVGNLSFRGIPVPIKPPFLTGGGPYVFFKFVVQ